MDTKDLEIRINNMGRRSISYWKDGVLVGKKCTVCGEDKEISEFGYANKKKGTYRAECKECRKQYREKNKDRTREYGKRYREENKEYCKEKNRRWEENNKEKRRQRYIRNYEYYKEYRKQHSRKEKEDNIAKITNMLHQTNSTLKRIGIKAYGYIYKVTGPNNHYYIGQSTQMLERRYKNGTINGWIKDRRNKVNQKFLEELEEESNFSIEIIDYGICQYHLDKLEVYYINKYDSCNNGYNNYEGNHNTTDGLEEFQQILKENGLEFIDNKLQIKNTHQDR